MNWQKKYGRMALLLLAFFMVCGGANAQAAENPAMGPGTVVYNLGDMEFIAVRDAISERSRDLLIGDEKLIKTLMPKSKSVGYSNTYVVKTKESIILIDTGWGAPKGQTLENLKKIGITPDKIDVILFTHLHGDHVSGLLTEGKVVFPNAKIYLAEAERAYWFDDDFAMNKNRAAFRLARKNIEAYGDRVKTFMPGDEVVPGITAIRAYGHTPGHVGYLVKSQNEKVLVWGDLTHFNEIQMAMPEIAVRYDIDPTQAIASRQLILEWVVRENIPVAGMHILYPGVGKIRAQEDNGYVFEPLEKLD